MFYELTDIAWLILSCAVSFFIVFGAIVGTIYLFTDR